MHQLLADYIDRLPTPPANAPTQREKALAALAEFVRACRMAGQPARLVFICTHNSRRSQLAQAWAAVAAEHRGVEGVESFSGGTEATAVAPGTLGALQNAGFEVDASHAGPGAAYQVRWSHGSRGLTLFSKRHDADPNPRDGFAAVMTCSEADGACPVVPGAALRVSLPYPDPKSADGTPDEAAAYDRCCRSIATDMLHLFSQVRAP